MKKFFSNLFRPPADQEFISLIQVALEEPRIRAELLKILSLPDHIRRETLIRWRMDLEQQNAPELITKALIYLEHDGRAKRALEILTENTDC